MVPQTIKTCIRLSCRRPVAVRIFSREAKCFLFFTDSLVIQIGSTELSGSRNECTDPSTPCSASNSCTSYRSTVGASTASVLMIQAAYWPAALMTSISVCGIGRLAKCSPNFPPATAAMSSRSVSQNITESVKP